MRRALVCAVALACSAFSPSFAEAASPPMRYSVVETASLFVAGQTIKIYRDGERATMEQFAPKQPNGTQPPHTRTFYDLKGRHSYTLDLDNPLVSCSVSAFTGDWGDPFASSAEIGAELAKQKPIAGGLEIVNGIETKILVTSTPRGIAKLWIEPRSGLVIKWEAREPKGQPQTMMEVTTFSTEAPPASLLDVPASCTKTARDNRNLHLTTLPGGGEGGVASAIVPPASKNSCTALLRVTRAGSMSPLQSGYQLAIDRDVDPDHLPSYSIGLTADGRAQFGGGKLREQTGAIEDGIFRIENMPRQIHVELCFGKGGCASALIYRQCTALESTLVYAVRNPARLSDGGDWLWIKAKPVSQ